MDEAANETRLTVGGVAESGLARLSYTYDFGDDWEHDVVIENQATWGAPLANGIVRQKEDCALSPSKSGAA